MRLFHSDNLKTVHHLYIRIMETNKMHYCSTLFW